MDLVSKRRTAQPRGLTGPSDDWVKRGLVALFDTRNAIEVMAGNRASAISSTLMGAAGGLAADFSGTANQQYAHRAAYATTGAMSLLILCDVDALSGYGALIAKQASSTTYAPYELRLGASSTDSRINFLRAYSSIYSQVTPSGSNLVAAGSKLVRIVLACGEGFGPAGAVWVNGSKTTFAATSGIPAEDNGASVWIGRRSDGGTQLDGRIYHIGLLNRAATDEDAAEFDARPFSLFEPRRIWVPVSAGGGSVSLIVADATHAHTADGLVLTSSTALSVADATHAHAADAITLVVGSVLAIAEASHAHAADSPALTAASALAVADATHAHAADSGTLTAASVLAIQEALHAHAADATVLTMDSALAVAETLHAQAADNLVLGVAGTTNLVVADVAHAHSADVLVLTSAHALAIADAIHGHSVEGLTLSVASVLAIQEALHAHAAENLALETTGSAVLLLADSLHAHTSDGAALTVDAWLVAADAAHGHSADNVVFTFGGAIPTDTLPMMVPLQNSYMLVAPERA